MTIPPAKSMTAKEKINSIIHSKIGMYVTDEDVIIQREILYELIGLYSGLEKDPNYLAKFSDDIIKSFQTCIQEITKEAIASYSKTLFSLGSANIGSQP